MEEEEKTSSTDEIVLEGAVEKKVYEILRYYGTDCCERTTK